MDSILVPGSSARQSKLIPWVVGIVVVGTVLAAVVVGIYRYWPSSGGAQPVETVAQTNALQPDSPDPEAPSLPAEGTSAEPLPNPSTPSTTEADLDASPSQQTGSTQVASSPPVKTTPATQTVRTPPKTDSTPPSQASGSQGTTSSPPSPPAPVTASSPAPTVPARPLPSDPVVGAPPSETDTFSSSPPPAQTPAVDSPQIVVPPSPPRVTTPEPAPYSGPRQGTIVWSGEARKGEEITINGRQVTQGRLTGELPGVACIVTVSDRNVAIAEAPGPRNQYTKIVLRFSRNVKQSISISWEVIE